MHLHIQGLRRGFLVLGFVLGGSGLLLAEESSSKPSSQQLELKTPETEKQWMQPIPVPADPELEEQIVEVQGALSTIDKQIVRHKEALGKAQDSATKTSLYEQLELLRKERNELEALLHDLVDEAKVSEQTAIDEALAHARWLERQQEYQEKKEELIRDRQQ